jgi:glycosyltransferase involved in cell wall biosynthesis
VEHSGGPDLPAEDRRDGRIVVLFVLYLAENSGIWQVTRNLVATLDPKLFRRVLVSPRAWPMISTLPSDVRVRFAPIPRLSPHLRPRSIWRVLREAVPCVAALRRIIREERIDVVHCNGLPNIFVALAAVSADVPLVWHVHELEMRPRFAFRALCWLCRVLADRIACVSVGVQKLFGASRKALVIYNGIDVGKFSAEGQPASRALVQRLGLPPGAFVVTQLGRVVPLKGVEWFIALAEAFLARGAAGAECVRFLLVGDPIAGHERYFEAIRDRMRSSAVREHLVYLPALDDPRDLLALTDVLVQSSVIAESFGLNVVEAMSMGKPVIASDLGGPTEIIHDGVDGFLASPYDPERRAEILSTLVADRGRLARLGAAARERARERFSAERMAVEFQGLYQALCQPAAGGAREALDR